jgi:hypothetical protein
MENMNRKWFLAPLLVGALAVGLVGGGSILAQAEQPLDEATSSPRQHGDQHDSRQHDSRQHDPRQHDEQHERP